MVIKKRPSPPFRYPQHLQKKIISTPGPGAYDPKNPISSPQWTFPKSDRGLLPKTNVIDRKANSRFLKLYLNKKSILRRRKKQNRVKTNFINIHRSPSGKNSYTFWLHIILVS